jgi:NADH:ubiquinone oxidoreductase subunit 2 (subunit N)
MTDWANIPWVLLLPLTAGAGLVAFETAQWKHKTVTIWAAVAFAFCAVAFSQLQQSSVSNLGARDDITIPSAMWSDAVLLVTALVGVGCLLCSLDEEDKTSLIGRQAATMLFGIGCIAVLCFSDTLAAVLAAYAAFVVSQSATLQLCAVEHRTRSSQNWAVISFALLAVGFVLLFALTRSTHLSEIHRVLQDSYEPTRNDLIVGKPSFLGVTAIVLIVGACAGQIGSIPLHTFGEDRFDRLPGWLAVWLAVSNRAFAFILLWRIVVWGVPGFQLDVQLILLIVAGFSAFGGACLAARAQSLRGLFHAGWIVSGGFLLMTMAIAVRQSDQINVGKWHFPDVLETALFGFAVTSIALCIGIACEQILRLPDRRVDFVEDLAGLSKRRPLVAISLAASLLTICAFPPMPGFWNVIFMTVNAYAPQAEAPASPVLIPNTAVLIANALVVVSIVFFAARSIDFLSMMFLEQPLGRYGSYKNNTTLTVAVIMASALFFVGVSPSGLIWAIHALTR